MMIDFAALAAAFPDLADLQPLAASGGQKLVFKGSMKGAAVALKVIHPGQDPERITREIRAVVELGCDYIPEILDYGEREISGRRMFYIVESFVEGETYASLLQKDKPNLEFVLGLADQLLPACRDFEARNLVHRDIKPANIIIDPSGKVWIIDFGIVRFLDLESRTPTDAIRGPSTLGYGAPEQLRNIKSEINSRSDLYSVGVVLYESLHGSNPYLDDKRDEIEVINHQTQHDLPRLQIEGDTPDGQFSEFIGALCSRFPSRRPQSASEALDWFAGIHSLISPTSKPRRV